MFELRGKLSRRQSTILGIIGFLIFLGVWWILAELLSEQRPIVEYDVQPPSEFDTTGVQINRDSIFVADSIRMANATDFEKVYPLLPPPAKVVKAYPSLIKEDMLLQQTIRSIWLNLQGYFWALFIAIPIGFLIGLVPLFRGLFSKQVDAIRYLPLTAVTGLFIIWFGIEDKMKIAFLAFGILVYLLPIVVQRIDEVNSIYLKTVKTLGASDWQTIRTVYIPSVFSKLMDDIRVLTAISWTYIIIAELINRQGGIGALIYLKARQGFIEKVFAILIVIILIGFLQDRLFVYLDKRVFPYKHYKKTLPGIKESAYGLYTILIVFAIAALLPIFFGGVPAAIANFLWIAVIASILITLYGEFQIFKSVKK